MSMRSIMTWQPVLWPKPWGNLKLRHMESIIDHARSRPDQHRGEATWSCSLPAGRVGVAWQWVEVRRGVVSLSNPMGIRSNLQVVGDNDEPVCDSSRAVVLNSLVHGLDWQSQIRRLLREQSSAIAPRRTVIDAVAVHA